ncbi:MAG: hypothetical protein AAF151_23360, partial [Cyanobacteria bacterium J06656_5]
GARSLLRDVEHTKYLSLSHHRRLPEMTPVMSMDEKTFAQDIEDRNRDLAPQLLEQAAKRISWVNTPVILAGDGVTQTRVRDALMDFATRLRIPIVNTLMAKGSIPNSHPLFLGTINSPQTHSRYGFDWADLVITVGCDAVECAPQYWNPDGDIPILHIDNSSAKLSHYYQPNLELIGNLSNLLAKLSTLANRDGKQDSYFLELCALNSDKP